MPICWFLLAVMRLKKRGSVPFGWLHTKFCLNTNNLMILNKTIYFFFFYFIVTFLSADWIHNLSEYKRVSLMILWIPRRLNMTLSWLNTSSFWVCSGLVMTLRRISAKVLMWVTNTGDSWNPWVTSYLLLHISSLPTNQSMPRLQVNNLH